MSDLVQNMQVSNERTSSTRYLAELTFRFKKNSVRSLLRRDGISFAETRSKKRLVLPVYDAAGAQLLWDEPNPWRAAWANRAVDPESPVPLVLPAGDLADIADIGPAQALAADAERLGAIAGRYGVDDVLIAHAVLEVDLAANVPRLHLTLRQIGRAGEGVVIRSFVGISRKRVPELLAEAVGQSVERLEEDWKRDNLLHFDNPVRLSARVPLRTLRDWLEVRSRLRDAAIVRDIVLVAISKSSAQVVLHYLGGPDQLALVLAQRDLDLSVEKGFWTLTLRANRRPGATAGNE